MQQRAASFIPAASTVPEAIAWWARQTPDAPALLGIAGELVTLADLQRRIASFGRQLAALGIGRSQRVVLALPDGLPTVIAGLGTLRAAVAVPVNPNLPLTEIVPHFDAIDPALVITTAGGKTAWREVAAERGVPVRELDAMGALVGVPPATAVTPDSLSESNPGDLALILLTSGTTDVPRRVPASHAAVLATCSARVRDRYLSPRDRGLNFAPAYFVTGLARVIESLLPGGSAIVASAREIVQFPETIRDLAPTWAAMSPAVLETLLDAARSSPAIAEWPLRFVRLGGANATAELIARGEAFWNVPVLNGYGATETLGYIAAEVAADDEPRKRGSVGKARHGLEIVIRNPDGAALPSDTIGEITVRGDRVFPGYLDDPAATAAAFFPDGWYRTGDLGYLDDDGFLFVTGREREMINRGGEKIAPAEVDEVLRQHPAVADAAAFALSDARLGQDVAVAVVLRPGMSVTPRQLRSWMHERLTRYKVPRRIWFVEELPRTGSTKVQRNVLADRFRNHAGG